MRPIVLATWAFAALSLAPGARAVTIDTFSFSQSGYSSFSDPYLTGGVLNGVFTGTVESNGYIELADLTKITDNFAIGEGIFFGNSASFFSFYAGLPAAPDPGALALAGSIGVRATVCVGAPVGLLASCNLPLGAPVSNGIVLGDFVTPNLPTVTLISSVSPPPAPAPEPGVWAMLLLGSAAIGARLRRRPLPA